MFPYVQTSMSAWHSFMDVHRRHETSGSDIKDHTARSNSSSHDISVFFTVHGASVPGKSGERTMGQLHAQWVTWGQFLFFFSGQ